MKFEVLLRIVEKVPVFEPGLLLGLQKIRRRTALLATPESPAS